MRTLAVSFDVGMKALFPEFGDGEGHGKAFHQWRPDLTEHLQMHHSCLFD